MAKAIREPAVYTLTLTEEEATVLHSVTGCADGSCTRSPRRHLDAIFTALENAGIQEEASNRIDKLQRCVEFSDYPTE